MWIWALSLALAGDGAAFACCKQDSVDAVVDAYVALVDRLIEDKSISAHVEALQKAASSSTKGLDSAEVVQLKAVREAVKDLPTSRSAIRKVLPELSRHVVFLALRQEGGSGTVVEAYCPGKGSWLQSDHRKPRSPYGGSCASWR